MTYIQWSLSIVKLSIFTIAEHINFQFVSHFSTMVWIVRSFIWDYARTKERCISKRRSWALWSKRALRRFRQQMMRKRWKRRSRSHSSWRWVHFRGSTWQLWEVLKLTRLADRPWLITYIYWIWNYVSINFSIVIIKFLTLWFVH